MFARFSTVAGERGAADAKRDIRGFALKFNTEEGNWDIVGNNTPIFFFRGPLRFPDLNHAIKRDPRTGLRSADNNWDFWSLLPKALHQVTIVMSNRGVSKSFRHMHGFGSHTFSMINAAPIASGSNSTSIRSRPSRISAMARPPHSSPTTARAMGAICSMPLKAATSHAGRCSSGVAQAVGLTPTDVAAE